MAGAFYGVVDSQRGSRGFYDQEVAFAGRLDFAKLLKVEALGRSERIWWSPLA